MPAEMHNGTAYMPDRRGGPCITDGCRLHKCGKCDHHTEMTFVATSETHRILNRSGEPITESRDVGLCVRCWSELYREDEGD